MAWSRVQGTTAQDNTFDSTTVLAFVSTVTLNTHLFVSGVCPDGVTINSVADDQGNSWTVDVELAANGARCFVASARNTNGDGVSLTITVTYSGSAASKAVAIEEWSGGPSAGWAIAGDMKTNSWTTSQQIGLAASFTPSEDNTLLFASHLATVPNTPVSPWSELIQAEGLSSYVWVASSNLQTTATAVQNLASESIANGTIVVATYSVTGSAAGVTDSDTITLTEAIAIADAIEVSDTLSVAEATALLESQAVTDTISFTETVSGLTDAIGVTDALTFTESVSVVDAGGAVVTASDDFTLTESLALQDAIDETETISFTETSASSDLYALNESLSFSEAVAVLDILAVSDTFTFTDSASIGTLTGVAKGTATVAARGAATGTTSGRSVGTGTNAPRGAGTGTIA